MFKLIINNIVVGGRSSSSSIQGLLFDFINEILLEKMAYKDNKQKLCLCKDFDNKKRHNLGVFVCVSWLSLSRTHTHTQRLSDAKGTTHAASRTYIHTHVYPFNLSTAALCTQPKVPKIKQITLSNT